MKVSPAHAPVRWTAPTPGMPARFERLRFMSADAGDAGTPGAPPAAPVVPAPAPVAVAVTPAPPAEPAAADDLANLAPAELAKMVRELRAENGAARTNAKTQAADSARLEVTQQIAKALGITADPLDVPKPDELAAQVSTAQQAARQAQVELAIYRAAPAAKGDPSALLDSRTFLAKVADLDPTAGDFQTKVTAAITAAVTENPKLGATPAVGSSSVDHAGGTGEQRIRTPKSLDQAVAAHYGTA